MFHQRLTGRLSLEFISKKDNEGLLQALRGVEKEAIYLDPLGTEFTSLEFHSFLFKTIESKKRVMFVIGGAEGFPLQLQKIGTRVSLSKMTFTHEMALLFLTEQIYRSFQIEKNSGYHKY